MNPAIRPGDPRAGRRAPLRGPNDLWLSSAVAVEAGASPSVASLESGAPSTDGAGQEGGQPC